MQKLTLQKSLLLFIEIVSENGDRTSSEFGSRDDQQESSRVPHLYPEIPTTQDTVLSA